LRLRLEAEAEEQVVANTGLYLDWMGTRERHSGLEEEVDAVWLAGWFRC
jgi:hypothetical protein